MQSDLNNKIVNGLERVSEAFKALLWEKAKVHGISPIQIQILLFLSDHKADLCKVSSLAKEFNLTKPTISDAVRVLDNKELVVKDHSSADSRSYTLFLSTRGKKLVKELQNYSLPLEKQLETLDKKSLTALFSTLTELIYQLNRNGILTVQRTCLGCRFYVKKNRSHYCKLLEQPLLNEELRIDCPEFEERE